MNTSYLHIHYKTQVWILTTECRVGYILYLEINGWRCNRFLYTPNNTTNTLHQYCSCTCVTMRIIEKCNRPKLFMITGRNGLYFLLRLGRLSYANGFQYETLCKLWMMRRGTLLILGHGVKVNVNFCSLFIRPIGYDSDYSFCPITFKLHLKVVDDERRNAIDFGSRGKRSRSSLALCV